MTEQQYNASADKSFTVKGSTGQPVPATRLNWQYTPGSGGTVNTAASPTSPGASNTARQANSTYPSSRNTTAGTAATPSTTAPATSTTTPANTTAGNPISDSVNSSKQAITASGATAVTDTMSSATTAVTGALQNGMGRLFRKKQAAAAAPDASQQAAASTPAQPGAATPAAPAASAFAVTADTTTPTPGAAAAPAGSPSFVFCHLVSSGSEYVSDIFPSTDSSDAAAQTAFWRQVGHQYKLGSIPFSNNVTCARSGSESGATSARQTLMASAPTKGLKIVDTQWTWMGQ